MGWAAERARGRAGQCVALPCSMRTRKGTRRSLIGELTRWQPMVSL